MGGLPEREYTKAELEQMHQQTCPGCASCLRAENARLQERVAWQERWLECYEWYLKQHVLERDEARALAERRKEALKEERERVAWLLDALPKWQKRSAAYKTVKEGYARAAIEEEGKR